jgi:hypothetical protein
MRAILYPARGSGQRAQAGAGRRKALTAAPKKVRSAIPSIALRRNEMIGSVDYSLLAGRVPTKDVLDICLRSTAALAQVACDAGDSLSRLQIETLRSATNDCALASSRLLAPEPSEAGHATILDQAISYWRSMASLTATTQAKMADVMASGLHEISRATESSVRQDDQGDMTRFPMAIYSAVGASALASAQAVYGQMGDLARQFAANSEGELLSTGATKTAQSPTARPQRKAA